jgi:hypothetical protein
VIDFTSGVGLDVDPLGNGKGLFDIIPPVSGSFVGMSGTVATIQDLNAATVPAGTTVSFPFITFAAQPTWSITLTQLLPGIHSSASCGMPAAGGQTCTPFAGSPFNLTNNTATSSTVSFTFLGTAVDSATPTLISNVQGIFTSQFSDMNFQQLLAIVSGGGFVVNSDSAAISVSAIPEPGTLSTAFLGGLLIVGSILSRKFRR